jgi:hypothetical protein
MGLRRNMKREKEFFSSSIKLQAVATGLKKLLDGNPLDPFEIKGFDYMGDLFGELDWESRHYKKEEHPELSAIATELRPFFYKAILVKKINFVPGYSRRIYQNLKSAGEEKSLSYEEIFQVQGIFQFMADNALRELQAFR